MGPAGYGPSTINNKGYGTINNLGRTYYVHRLVYEWFVGPLVEGLQIDHLCRTRHCVNPRHLEQVTAKENMHRGTSPHVIARLEERCMKGHAMTGDNLYVSPRGRRGCYICIRARWQTAS